MPELCIRDSPTAADPKYDSAFTKKQKSLDEDEAKQKIEELAGKSLDEVKAALGDVTVVEQFKMCIRDSLDAFSGYPFRT